MSKKIKLGTGNRWVEVDDDDGVPPERTISAGIGLTGGGDLSADRALAVAEDGITNTLLRNSAGMSVIGRSAASAGDPADITAGTDHQVLRRSGSVVGFGSVALNQPAATSGVLPVGKGGTGRAAVTSGRYLRGAGAGALVERTPAQVWQDVGPEARADANTWTGQQTFSAEALGRMADGPAPYYFLAPNVTLDLTARRAYILGAESTGHTVLSFLGAGEAKTRVIYLVCIGAAAGRELVWPSGITVHPPSGSAPETSYEIPAGVRTVVQLLQVNANDFYRLTG